jgi:hypothetical protein
LNHLLGGDYLPVNVTPVTAVPTRITFGSRPQVFVEFADSRPQVVELSALAEFATEQRNPGNERHVSRIRVEAPAATLREGITFVDTPGLGSLATSGAEETVAYCTNCWREVQQTATVCAHCGDDIAGRQARSDYTDKLIAALHHPEPTTPIRAAWILGQQREHRAVEPLCRLVRESSDAFIVESAVEALGRIGDVRAKETLRWAMQHSTLRVADKARESLGRLISSEHIRLATQ